MFLSPIFFLLINCKLLEKLSNVFDYFLEARKQKCLFQILSKMNYLYVLFVVISIRILKNELKKYFDIITNNEGFDYMSLNLFLLIKNVIWILKY